MNLKEVLERNPIIPALKNEKDLDKVVKSDSEIVFVILSSILNVDSIVETLKNAGKMVFVHIDMIEGLSSGNFAVDYVMNKVKPDGIITTKHNLVSYANKNNIPVIQRFFVLDSFSLVNTINYIKENRPIAVEILPGLMPKIIKKIRKQTRIPIITGGLITEKEDIINALSSGAIGVSTTESSIWEMS